MKGDIYAFLEGLRVGKKLTDTRINAIKTRGWVTKEEIDEIKAKKQKKGK